MSLLPTLIQGGGIGGAESPANVVAWTALNAASQVPSAMANIAAQAYLLRAGAHLPPPAGRRASLVGVFRFVFYNQVFVAALTAGCFWVDLLPWFGSSATPGQFADGLAFSVRCSLLGPAAAGPPPRGAAPGASCSPSTPLYAALSILPYGAYLAGTALVSQDSGVFGNVVQVLMSVAISLVWLVPGLNPAAAATPLWSILPALALALLGSVVYKRWELRTEAGAAGGGGGVGAGVRGLQPVPDAMHAYGAGHGATVEAEEGGAALEAPLLLVERGEHVAAGAPVSGRRPGRPAGAIQ